MILPANRCRNKSPDIYIADEFSEVEGILNPKPGDIALAVGDGFVEAWRLLEDSDEPDGFNIVASNSCDYIWKRSGDFVNVALFGATPNTSEEQTAAFQRAIDAAPVDSTMFVPPGTFILNGVQVGKNLSWYLSSGAILKMRSEATAPMIEYTTFAEGTIQGGLIDGNKAGQTQATWYPVVRTRTSTKFLIDRVIFKDCAFAAIRDNHSTGLIEISRCQFRNAAEHGGVTTIKSSLSIYLASVGIQVYIHHNKFIQDDVPSAPGKGPGGILVAGCKAANISDNYFYRVGQTFALNHLASIHFYELNENIAISNNHIEEPMWDGILVQNSYRARISGNHVWGDGGANALCAKGIWANPTIRTQTEGPNTFIVSENIVHDLPLAIGIWAYAEVAHAKRIKILNNSVTDTLNGIRVSGVAGSFLLKEPMLISGNTVQPTTGYGIRLEAISGDVILRDNDVRATSSHALWALTDLTGCRLHMHSNYLSTTTLGFYGGLMRGLAGLYIHSGIFSNSAGSGVAYTVDADASANPVAELMINSDAIKVLAGTTNVTTPQVTAWARSTITLGIDPNGSIQAPIGSRYIRTSGGAGTTFYVKEGALNTNWVGK